MLTFRTAKNLCPNLQKPPLPSKIPAYAPEAHAKIYDIKFKMFPKWIKTAWYYSNFEKRWFYAGKKI